MTSSDDIYKWEIWKSGNHFIKKNLTKTSKTKNCLTIFNEI